jgi:hypothetical protein
MNAEDLQILQDNADLSAVLSTGQGRRVLYRIITGAGVTAPSFAEGHGPDVTAYHEGKRSVGIGILTEIFRLDRMKWIEMQAEAANAVVLASLPPKDEVAP